MHQPTVAKTQAKKVGSGPAKVQPLESGAGVRKARVKPVAATTIDPPSNASIVRPFASEALSRSHVEETKPFSTSGVNRIGIVHQSPAYRFVPREARRLGSSARATSPSTHEKAGSTEFSTTSTRTSHQSSSGGSVHGTWCLVWLCLDEAHILKCFSTTNSVHQLQSYASLALMDPSVSIDVELPKCFPPLPPAYNATTASTMHGKAGATVPARKQQAAVPPACVGVHPARGSSADRGADGTYPTGTLTSGHFPLATFSRTMRTFDGYHHNRHHALLSSSSVAAKPPDSGSGVASSHPSTATSETLGIVIRHAPVPPPPGHPTHRASVPGQRGESLSSSGEEGTNSNVFHVDTTTVFAFATRRTHQSWVHVFDQLYGPLRAASVSGCGADAAVLTHHADPNDSYTMNASSTSSSSHPHHHWPRGQEARMLKTSTEHPTSTSSLKARTWHAHISSTVAKGNTHHSKLMSLRPHLRSGPVVVRRWHDVMSSTTGKLGGGSGGDAASPSSSTSSACGWVRIATGKRSDSKRMGEATTAGDATLPSSSADPRHASPLRPPTLATTTVATHGNPNALATPQLMVARRGNAHHSQTEGKHQAQKRTGVSEVSSLRTATLRNAKPTRPGTTHHGLRGSVVTRSGVDGDIAVPAPNVQRIASPSAESCRLEVPQTAPKAASSDAIRALKEESVDRKLEMTTLRAHLADVDAECDAFRRKIDTVREELKDVHARKEALLTERWEKAQDAKRVAEEAFQRRIEQEVKDFMAVCDAKAKEYLDVLRTLRET